MLMKRLINLLHALALIAREKLLDVEICLYYRIIWVLKVQIGILDYVLELTKEADA